ncbi:hypothetical protein THAOC_12026 [Thalassiosira oceanica]|uniref:SKP1 component dimerisation domain-containing protein n=1 Tax=Thalassiosira oceanica TaxID=159749 RepID=K0SPS0_THAOC|nr:hypothetical protein THAOC_12026 [Thalassiosira oceanica]|eukprot:EJK66994.1 hypothetical protein THAOC_12026 [Thalassiosira oceanica]
MKTDSGTINLISKLREYQIRKGQTRWQCFFVGLGLTLFPIPTRTPFTNRTEGNDNNGGTEIPLPEVKAAVLSKVIEFCQHYTGEPMTEIEKPLKSAQMGELLEKWYADFVNVEQALLFELILAANYMGIKPLLDLTCAKVASMIKGKTPEGIRKTFNIAKDPIPKEEVLVSEDSSEDP